MISQDIELIVERLRELADAEELTLRSLKVGLFNLEECADRVRELETRPPRIVRVQPPPAPASAVVRLEDYRSES